MKGWEVYAKDWGCGDWDKDLDEGWEKIDRINHNVALKWCPGFIRFDCGTSWIRYFFRQPTPVQVLEDERRLRHQIKLMQDQWRRALYDPTRAVCRKRIEAEFRDLSEQEDRIGCNDT